MLQKLNERIQGVIAWVVIILIAVTFTLFGVDYYMQSRQASDTQVDVNGQAITKQAYEVNYRRARHQRDAASLTEEGEAALRKKVLTDMITNEVSIQAARKAGFDVSIEQANAAILSIPQFQQDGRFSQERYQQALSGAMFTPESFQKEVRQGMLLNQQRFAFIGSAFALPDEIKRFVKLYMQTRNYSYLEIPASLFIKDSQVSDDTIQKYYEKHQKEFLAPEKVSIDYVRLSTQQIKDKMSVSLEDIQRYYDENKSSFLTPAQWKVAHILFAVPEDASDEVRNKIKENAKQAYDELQAHPEKFDDFVSKHSDDKLSLASKGVLPWLVAGQSGFDKTLAQLANPGQISPPVKSPHGYEIFKLIAYKPAVQKPLTNVETVIKEQLLAERAQAKYAQAFEQLGDLSYQSPDSLTPVADALKLQVEHSKLFSREGGNSELAKNKQVINAAFSHDVLELGNNSEPIQLDNDTVIVLRVNKHIPAKEKPLTEVKESIAKKLALQQAEKRAKQLGSELLATKESNEQEQILKKNQLQWHEVLKAPREGDKVDPAINELAFNMPRPGSRDGRTLGNGNYVIVQLKEINDGQLESLDKEQQASLAQQIETNYGLMDYDLYINNLVTKAKIVEKS